MPYADLDQVREQLIQSCRDIMLAVPSYNRNYADMLEEYVEGKLPTMPNSLRFRDALVRVLLENYREYRSDARWHDGCSELKRYFFFSGYWKIAEEDSE